MSRGMRGALRLPVIARDTAEQLGRVEGFVVDPVHHRIEAVHLGGSKRHPQIVDWTAIAAFGDDAVIVDRPDAVREPDGENEQRVASGKVAMLDQRVLDDLGDALGTVTEVLFDEQTGTIATIATDSAQYDAEQLLGVGTYAIVIAHAGTVEGPSDLR